MVATKTYGGFLMSRIRHLSGRVGEKLLKESGVDLFNGVQIGYSFDYSYSTISNYVTAGGSHEVMISYCFSLIKEKIVKKYKSVRFL